MGARKLPKKAGPAAAKAKAKAKAADVPSDELRYEMIAHAAYLRAEQRGFAPGQELDDWLAAAAEVDARLAAP